MCKLTHFEDSNDILSMPMNIKKVGVRSNFDFFRLRLSFRFIDLDKMSLESPKCVSLYIRYQKTKPASQKTSYTKTEFSAKNSIDSDSDSENDSVQVSNIVTTGEFFLHTVQLTRPQDLFIAHEFLSQDSQVLRAHIK